MGNRGKEAKPEVSYEPARLTKKPEWSTLKQQTS